MPQVCAINYCVVQILAYSSYKALCINKKYGNFIIIEMHFMKKIYIFSWVCDAACCCYDNKIAVSLVASKTRVKSKNTMSVHRLELMAAYYLITESQSNMFNNFIL